MIALAIAGIVVASLFAVYDKTLEVGEQVREQAELEQSARMIFQQLHKDFQGLYYRRSRNASSPGPYCFLGSEEREALPLARNATALLRMGSTTSLDFQNATFPEGRLFRVRYLLEGSGSEEGPQTLLREQLAFPGIRKDARRIALTDKVSRVGLSFVDSTGRSSREWYSARRLAGQQKAPLPKLVVVEMTLQSEEGTERTYSMRFSVNGSEGNAGG